MNNETIPGVKNRLSISPGYIFAVFLMSLVVAFSFEDKPNEGYRLKSEPPLGMLTILLPMIGVSLGIEIDPSKLFSKKE